MSHQAPAQPLPQPIEAGRQVARLRSVLLLVEELAGGAGGDDSDAALDESACFSSAYAHAQPIAQRRFDALADETACWAATAVEALLAHQDAARAPRAAAAHLAAELGRSLGDLARIVRA